MRVCRAVIAFGTNTNGAAFAHFSVAGQACFRACEWEVAELGVGLLFADCADRDGFTARASESAAR